MLEYGYGVVFSQASFKEDAAALLLERAFDMGNDGLYHMHSIFCDNYGYSYDSRDGMKEYVEFFEDDYTGCGLGALLARVIDDAAFEGEDYFVFKDNCLYVKAEIPIDDEDKQRMPTVKDIQRLLSVYLNPLLESPCSPCYIEVVI